MEGTITITHERADELRRELDEHDARGTLTAELLSSAVRTFYLHTSTGDQVSVGIGWIAKHPNAFSRSDISTTEFFIAHEDIPRFVSFVLANQNILSLLPEEERSGFLERGFRRHHIPPRYLKTARDAVVPRAVIMAALSATRTAEINGPANPDESFLDSKIAWGLMDADALHERLRACAAVMPVKFLHARADLLRHLSEAKTDALIRMAIDNLRTLQHFPAIGTLRKLLPLHLRWELCRRFPIREHGLRACFLLLDTTHDMANEENEGTAVQFLSQMIPKTLEPERLEELRRAAFERSPLPEWTRDLICQRLFDHRYVVGTIVETKYRNAPRYEVRTNKRIYVHRFYQGADYRPKAGDLVCFPVDDTERIGTDRTDERPRGVFLTRFYPLERAAQPDATPP